MKNSQKSKTEVPPWMVGKRFIASLQKPDDPHCYKDFFDSNTLTEAQGQARNSAEREQRKAIVFDRHLQSIVFRCDFSPGSKQ